MKTNSVLRRWLALAFMFALGLAPARAQTQVINRKIQPNDVLIVRVLNEPDMMAEKKVSNEGKINYFFIGDVDVAGRSIQEAQDLIRDLLNKDYLVDPQVNIEMKQYALEMITVLGAVAKPGPIQLPPDRRIDIVEAIGMAGDFNRYAKKNHIELRRKGVNTRYSYDKLRELTDPEKKVMVEPDDVIEVFESVF